MQCPSCGFDLEESQALCPACRTHVADALRALLDDDDDDDEDDDDEESERAGAEVPAYALDADPVILGDGGGDLDPFLSEGTGAFTETAGGVVVPAPASLSGDSRAMLKSHAVLRLKSGADLDALSLSPFEQHVASQIDGLRPVARLRAKTGLASEDLRIALGMLLDRQLLELRGFLKRPPGFGEGPERPAQPPPRAAAVDDEVPADLRALFALDDDEDDALSPFGGESLPPTLVEDLLEPAPPSAASDLLPLAERGPAAATADDDELDIDIDIDAAAPAEAPIELPLDALTPLPGGAAPAVKPALRAARSSERATHLLDLAMKDLEEGRGARAKSYAQMGLAEFPDDPRFAGLLATWGAVVKGSQRADRPEVKAIVDEARAHEQQGDFKAAERVLRLGTKAHPGAATLYNRLGVLLHTRLADEAGAKQALARAVELAPDSAVYRHNLGKVARAKRS